MRFRTSYLLRVAVLVAFAAAARAADAPPTTRPAAVGTVVCFGDSITAAGYPDRLAEVLGTKVVNAGVGGNTTAMALKRIDKDVLARRPDVVVIFFGTNDSRLAEPDVWVPVDKYEANLARIVDLCRDAGATKVVLCTPPPIDATAYFKRHKKEKFDAAGGLEKVLADYRAAVERVGEAKKAPVVDLNRRLADDPAWRAADGVHPTADGTRTIARLVAEALLRPVGTAGATTEPTGPKH